MKIKRNVLITGGAGFIGAHLSKALIEKGYNVTVLDSLAPQIHGDNPNYIPFPGVDFVKGDVRDKGLVSSVMSGIDAVFHLAAETGTGQSMYEIERYVSVNEVGTGVLLEAIGASSSVTDFVLASSRSIYGEGAYLSNDGVICQPTPRTLTQLSEGNFEHTHHAGNQIRPVATCESLPPSLGSIYAATKYSQEILCDVALRSSGVRRSTLRFQNVYGQGQSLRNPYTGIISIFYNRIRQGLPIKIYEDGHESRDFVHVDDVVYALVQSINRPNTESITINIGSGIPTSVLKLANSLIQASGYSAEAIVTGAYRVGDIRHCYADLNLASKTIGYAPSISLRAGLDAFCKWAKQEPESEDGSDFALLELKKKGLAN